MPSKIEIENWALIYLEEAPQVNILDTSAGELVDYLYDTVYEQMLKKNSYIWSFARKIATLGQLINQPTLEDYAFVYQLPTDYLMTKWVDNSSATFVIVGKLIYARVEPFKLLYCANVSEDMVTSEFAHAVAYDLASRAAGVVSGKMEIKRDLIIRAAFELKKAINLDIAQMDTQQYMWPNVLYPAKWQSGFPMGSFSNVRSVGGT